ncbi:MAG: polysaccharide deacetylase family protein [Pseudomonadota bacterium]
MPMKLCAVNIDLDPLTSYYQIHGLGHTPRQLRATIIRKVLPRFEELFTEAGIKATFFVVGKELEREKEAQETIRRLVEAGHELANHTYSHPYDLCRLPAQVLEEEIRRAHDVILDTVGKSPVGFRAPGYFVNGEVFRVLAGCGYSYDASMFPSPPYYAAKAAVIGGMALRGRNSASVLGDPRCFLSPPEPYRPDIKKPWKRGHSPLVELPVAVVPYFRVPAIGTMLAVSPPWMRRWVLRGMTQRSFFNFELHGIDLADAIADRIPTELAGRQPDLRVPFSVKRGIFLETLQELTREYRFVTLSEAAEEIQREHPL